MTAPDQPADHSPGAAKVTTSDLRQQVRSALKESGYSQAEIARHLSLSTKHMSQMLTGKKAMSWERARQIAEACGYRLAVSVAPSQPAAPATSGNDIRQQLADAIRNAADTHEPACGDGDCECDIAILSPMYGDGPTTRIEGSPDGLADVCAAVVQPVLDAKDAEIAQLLDIIERVPDSHVVLGDVAMAGGDKCVPWCVPCLRQRAEAAERELADLRDKAARLDELERQIGA